jgi:hypothetical protein
VLVVHGSCDPYVSPSFAEGAASVTQTGALLVLGHDPDDSAQLGRAPERYT